MTDDKISRSSKTHVSLLISSFEGTVKSQAIHYTDSCKVAAKSFNVASRSPGILRIGERSNLHMSCLLVACHSVFAACLNCLPTKTSISFQTGEKLKLRN